MRKGPLMLVALALVAATSAPSESHASRLGTELSSTTDSPHTKGCDPPAIPGWADRCPVWSATYDENLTGDAHRINNNYVTDVVAAPSGNRVFITGHSYGNSVGPWGVAGATVAFDANGTKLWSARTDAPASDNIWTMALSPDETTLYIAGARLDEQANADMLLVAYDAADGEELWKVTANTNAQPEWIRSITVAPDGSTVYAAGSSGFDPIAIAIAAEPGDGVVPGDIRWSSRWAKLLADYIWSIAMTPDGNRVIIGGESWAALGLGGDKNTLTVGFDASTGERIWSDVYDSPATVAGSFDVSGYSMAMSPDGSRAYSIGTSHGQGDRLTDFDVVLVARDPVTGQRVWTTTASSVPFEGNDAPFDVAVSPDGTRVFIAGTTTNTNGSIRKFLTLSFDAATGQKLWSVIDTATDRTFETAWAVAVAPDGSTVTVAGVSELYVDLRHDWSGDLTITYDASSGEKLWAGRFETRPMFSDAQLGVHPTLAVNPVTGAVYVASSPTTRRSSQDEAVAFDWNEYAVWSYVK